MTVQRSGVEFVGIGYKEYMTMLRSVNKAQREAFGSASQTSMTQFDKKSRAAAVGAKKLSGNLGALVGGVGMLVPGMAAAAGAIGLVIAAGLKAIKVISEMTRKFMDFIRQSGELAARNETLRVSLEQVGNQAGYTASQIESAVDQVKAKGITTKAATQALLKMAQAELEWTHAAGLARIAQDAAVIGNINSSEAFERMIHGIQVGNKLVLKNIGLNVNFQLAYKKSAAALGKSTLELTEQERAQARVNEVQKVGERIAGTYEAAMETAGKQQNSLARYIEETQAQIGTLLLPLKRVSIALKTEFWKGTQRATLGLTSWGIVIDETLKKLLKMKPESEGVFDAIGESLHNTARTFILFSITVDAAVEAALEALWEFFTRSAAAFNAFVQGDWGGAAKAMEGLATDVADKYGTAFERNYKRIAKAHMETMPQLFQTWEELKEAGDEDLGLVTDSIDDQVRALEDLKAEYEAMSDALKQVEEIQRRYNEALEDAARDYAKRLAQQVKDEAKARAKAEKDLQKQLSKLEQDAAEDREDIIRDHNKQMVEDQKRTFDQLESNRKRYELDTLQSLRRFQLSETRLRAEGDVLALKELRENYDLQQQEAAENFDLSQSEAEKAAQEEQKQQQEALDERLQELEEEIRDRRQEINAGYREELDELEASNAERRAEMAVAYDEQLDDLKRGRDRQLEELGRSLQREGEVTEEGMQNIADMMAEVFGEEGIGVSLVQGWAERSVEAVAQAGDDILGILERIDQAIDLLAEGGEISMSEVMTGRSAGENTGRTRGRGRGRVGMAQGGIGVVTGPALFEVEPGREEIVAFVPTGRYGGGASSSLDVNVAGGVDVRGGENASPMVVEAAISQMMGEIGAAVKRGRYT